MIESAALLKPSLAKQFHAAFEQTRVIFFSAPCGFGKSTAAELLLKQEGQAFRTRDAADPGFCLPSPEEDWNVLLLDRLPDLPETEQQPLCELIRKYPKRRFLLLSRGVPPGWLLSFQFSGLMTVFDAQSLAFDRQTTGKLLKRYGVTVSDSELTSIQEETQGYPLAVSILARRMAEGSSYNPTTSDRVRHEIFLHYEEAVYRRFDLPTRRFLLSLAPFEEFSPDLAKMVSGDSRVGELLGRLQRDTTMLIQDRLDTFHFWPIFRLFLRWELTQEYSPDQYHELYMRGGLYYELKENYGRALECYAESGNHSKVSELLEKNAQFHPGMGHYDEMEKYYRALPETEICASPALMQGMSMLCSLNMDYGGSERWYRELRDFAARHGQGDAMRKEALSRLAWLDIALPQRTVNVLIETIPAVFRLLTGRKIRLPAFSVTSTLPSIMNGGKDFSDWSKKDELLYATLRRPVEAVLGKDGIGLADLAMAESRFEKGEDITVRMLSLMSRLSDIQQKGTPDMEFAVVGLLVRTQIAAGRAQDAKDTLDMLEKRFTEQGLTRFLPNLSALRCRVDLRLGDDEAAERWYREKAPKDRLQMKVMKRYQYLTQAMAELAAGDERAALLTLAPLRSYFERCGRHIDGIYRNTLSAIAKSRLQDPDWKADLYAALDVSLTYRFIRPVASFGAAVLPLLDRKKCEWKEDSDFLRTVTSSTREQAACYPDFLHPRKEMAAPLSAAELQVLRLICADKSNAEIGEILDIRLATVKTHVSHILQKLGVSRRSEAKTAAARLRLL